LEVVFVQVFEYGNVGFLLGKTAEKTGKTRKLGETPREQGQELMTNLNQKFNL